MVILAVVPIETRLADTNGAATPIYASGFVTAGVWLAMVPVCLIKDEVKVQLAISIFVGDGALAVVADWERFNWHQ